MTFRSALKTAAHRFGALYGYHRWHHRHGLTAVMFHRVLPAAVLESTQADPNYTLTTEFFVEIVAFLQRHYTLVSLDQVLAAHEHKTRLASRALILTFDDGWRDNLDHALPILRRMGAPAALFAASQPIDEEFRCWWQEVLLWALRSGRRSFEQLWQDANSAGSDAPPAAGSERDHDLLLRYGALEPSRREAVLEPLSRELGALQPAPHMLRAPDLQAWSRGGMAVGAHGASHLPLTRVPAAADDIAQAKGRLGRHLGLADGVACLSFPHGRYNADVVAAARGAGYKLLFTSDPVINPCPDGWVDGDLIGRISVATQDIAGPDGRLSSERLAAWMFLRPRVALARSGDQRA